MKIVSCVGYHNTGSGAVDDFLREFNNISYTSYGVECRFLQDPDGISDLYYNIIENPHRLNTGYALKRYLKFVKNNNYTYSLIFGKSWKSESYKYVNDLTNFKYYGYWSGDMNLMSNWKKFTYYFRRLFNKMLPKKLKKPSTWNYFPKEQTMHCNLTKDEFINKTYNYIFSLVNSLNKENKEYVLLDQVASAINLMRYTEFFKKQIKIIVVDRDPRDVFIQETILKGRVLPKDVEKFCDVYKDSRKRIDSSINNDNILYINFENMIYEYEQTSKKICDFLELKEENHNRKKVFFNPNKSIKNTRLWEKYPEFSDECKIIEKLLPDFLYKYE